MLVTGCQRSGTMTISRVFKLYHEVQFTPTSNLENLTDNPVGECSWMLMPFIGKYPEHSIIHLVRNPVDVINSIVGIGFFKDKGIGGFDHGAYRGFVEKYLPIPGDWDRHSELDRACYYYYRWNQPLEHLPRIRIEDIKNTPVLNKRRRAHVTHTESRYRREIEEVMERYGY